MKWHQNIQIREWNSGARVPDSSVQFRKGQFQSMNFGDRLGVAK
jgi:hypothetical protein